VGNQELYVAARNAAGALGAEFPERCARWRVEISGVAEDLGVIIQTRPGMSGRAHWQRYRLPVCEQKQCLWLQEPREVDVIDVRADLRDSTRRFAIAHEIGHVIMHRRLRSLAEQLDAIEHERFANVFAAELLLARSTRETLIERFRDTADPVGLLRLSDSLGVSPQTVLRFARRENWLEGVDRVWLDIRALRNRHTGRDLCLRVYDAVLDRARWFLPRNRSVTGALGSDVWLTNADIRISRVEGLIDISRRREGHTPKFVHKMVPAHLAALRLGRTAAPHGMEYLASAELLEDQPAQDADAHLPHPDSKDLQTVLF